MFVEEEEGIEYVDKFNESEEKVIIDKEGFGEFFTPSAGVSVWVKQ